MLSSFLIMLSFLLPAGGGGLFCGSDVRSRPDVCEFVLQQLPVPALVRRFPIAADEEHAEIRTAAKKTTAT